jgi:homoserine kinase
MDSNRDRRPLFKVKTCATCANIGPGYDIAAIALDIFNECTVFKGKGKDHSINFRGPFAAELGKHASRDDLVIKAIRSVIKKFTGRIRPGGQYKNEDGAGTEEGSLNPAGVRLEGHEDSRIPEVFEVDMTVNIPPGKGLGSSASAVIAGLLIANKAYNMGLNKKELFQTAAEIESSPDNAAAALSGGMAVVYRSGRQYLFEKISLSSSYRILLMIPPGIADTKEARKLMPDRVPVEDVIQNISNFSLLVKYLEEDDPGGAAVFIKDHLYQKYRKDLYPRSFDLVNELIEIHGIPASISGAGPAVMAIMDKDMFEKYKNIKGRIAGKYLSFQDMVTGICDSGSYYL